MRCQTLLMTLVVAGCATAGPATLPAPVDDGTAVLAKMRAVRSRVARGQAPAVHQELAQQMSQRPGDWLPRFLDAVASMPSDGAWTQLKRLSTDVPDNPWPQLGMGAIYTAWHMFPQAIQSIARADALHPRYLPVALARAQLLFVQGDTGAQAAFEAVLRQADVPEAHAGLGEIALAQGNVLVAQRELGEASKGGVDGLDIEKALVKLSLDQRDEPSALRAQKEVVAQSPHDGKALAQLAKLEEDTGDVAGARRDYAQVELLQGADLSTAQHLVALARKAHDDVGLVSALGTLCQVDKDNPAPEMELAHFYAAAHDTPNAVAHLQAALARAPQDAQAELELARLDRDAGHTREAIEAYQAALVMPQPPATAQAELAPLVADLKLPDKPISGSVDAINDRFTTDLRKFYKLQLRTHPHLKGTLRLAVVVGADGKVQSVGLTPTGIDDQTLLLHAYFVMKQARFPKAKRSPVFEVELKP